MICILYGHLQNIMFQPRGAYSRVVSLSSKLLSATDLTTKMCQCPYLVGSENLSCYQVADRFMENRYAFFVIHSKNISRTYIAFLIISNLLYWLNLVKQRWQCLPHMYIFQFCFWLFLKICRDYQETAFLFIKENVIK